MKGLFIFTFVLGFQVQAEDVFQKLDQCQVSCSPECKQLVGKLKSSLQSYESSCEDSSLPVCEQSCQHWDNLNNVCQYESKCEVVGQCVVRTSCEYFDVLDGDCLREKREFQCPSLESSCEEYCQELDLFTTTCHYQTKCEVINGNCLRATECDQWDHINNKCLKEKSTLSCP